MAKNVRREKVKWDERCAVSICVDGVDVGKVDVEGNNAGGRVADESSKED